MLFGRIDELPGVVRICLSTNEQLKRSVTYVRGLLGNATHKNVEQMALGLGEKVRSLQYFVGQSRSKTEPAIRIHQKLVGETLGEEDGIALIDESSVVMQGKLKLAGDLNLAMKLTQMFKIR